MFISGFFFGKNKMTDRQIVQIAQVPQDTDILLTNKNSYIAIAKLAQAMFGTSTLINGFACTVGTGLHVSVAAGEIYSQQNIDNSGYGSLTSDTSHQIVKQGIILDPTVISVPAPPTGGQSINYLIQIAFLEQDVGSTILPYYNSAAPTVPFTGPGNDALPNNTIRQNTVSITAKAGTAATTGTQTTPSADSGYVGAFVVTVDNGESSLVSGDIVTYAGAPFLTNNLLSLINTLTTEDLIFYAADGGSVNAYTATISNLSAYAAGQAILLKVANTNTSATTNLTVNGLATKSIKLTNGNNINIGDLLLNEIAFLVYDGTNFQLLNPVTLVSQTQIQNNTFGYAADSGTANTYAITLSPVLTAYSAGQCFSVKILHTNTSATCTLNINSLGTQNIKLTNGNNPNIGDILVGMIADFEYDGTNFQLLNPSTLVSQVQIQNSTYSYAADTGGSANTYSATLSPAATAYTAGMYVELKIAHSNTGASTLNLNGLGTQTITTTAGAGLSSGQIVTGMIALFQYDGTNFQLLNPISVSISNGLILMLGQHLYI